MAGRYKITRSRIFAKLEQLLRGVAGEIQLTGSIAQLPHREKLFASRNQGVRCDCGSEFRFLQAAVDLCKHYPEVGEEFSAWLQA